MQDLIKQEQFEIEILELLSNKRILNQLIFTGGTMMRLCWGLKRFSVDLDFWTLKRLSEKKLFDQIKTLLSQNYILRDSANKFNTMLFEIKSKNYPRSLKIEIRKDVKKVSTEWAIAYSKHAQSQVFLQVVSQRDMMGAKIEAFLKRREIRDIFDIEFLLKKGVSLEAPPQSLKSLLLALDNLTAQDYKVKLGSLLEAEERPYYQSENFEIAKQAIQDKIKTSGVY